MVVIIFGNYDHLMIVYLVYVFYDQRPFYLVAMATLNLKKKYFFEMTATSKPLKMHDSNFSLNLVKMLLGKGQFKISRIVVICLHGNRKLP